MPAIPRLLHFFTRSDPVIKPLPKNVFTLDSSGVAGFFGGDGAVAGMATVNLYDYRWLGGWYNTPGSYEIAKQFGQLANSRFWNGLFPGGTRDPARLFGLDGKKGPKFVGTHSGSILERTGHLAYLVSRMASDILPASTPIRSGARTTTPSTVTVIWLPTTPEPPVASELKLRRSWAGYWALVPILSSIAACVVCGLATDWWSFGSILLGILASGTACLVLGSGKLTFEHPKPAVHGCIGDGVLIENQDVVVLRGLGGAVNSVTRGRFYLQYPLWGTWWQKWWTTALALILLGGASSDGRESYRTTSMTKDSSSSSSSVQPGTARRIKATKGNPPTLLIGLTSMLLATQFIVQLLIIPQGMLIGQIAFVITLAISWVYNAYLSSLNREDIQTEILLNILYPTQGVAEHIMQATMSGGEQKLVQKFEFGTWTAMAVFTVYALRPLNPPDILNRLIPNETPAWTAWKQAVSYGVLHNLCPVVGDSDREHLTSDDLQLLDKITDDAKEAYDVWEARFSRIQTELSESIYQ